MAQELTAPQVHSPIQELALRGNVELERGLPNWQGGYQGGAQQDVGQHQKVKFKTGAPS